MVRRLNKKFGEKIRSSTERETPLLARGPTRAGAGACDAASWSAACLRSIDPAVFDPIVAGEWLLGYDFAASLHAACPILLLQADTKAGGMLTEADARRIELESAECIRIPFPGQGHLLHSTATNAMLRAAVPFLDSVRVT